MDNSAWFDSAAWTIWEPFTNAEHTQALSRFCIKVPGRTSWELNPDRLLLPTQIAEEAAQLMSIREHEFSHFRQHTSTQMGMFIHRLCGIREAAARNYLYTHAASPESFAPIPFVIRLQTAASDAEKGCLGTWHFAETIENALWSKELQMDVLISMWNALAAYNHSKWLRADGPWCRLATKRHRTDSSCPSNVLTGQAIHEGLAVFREFDHIRGLCGEDLAIKIVSKRKGFIYTDAHHFAISHLDAQPFHYIYGALLDIATLCFLDPRIHHKDGILIWEDQHPGFRFQAAVEQLARTLVSIPDDIRDIYYEVIRAYNFDFDNWLPSGRNWLKNFRGVVPLSNIPQELRYLAEAAYEYQARAFISGLTLRYELPWLYSAFFFVPKYLQDRFAEETYPPVLIRPDGVDFTTGDSKTNLSLLIHALAAGAIDEFTRHGDLDRTVKFIQRMQHSGLRSIPAQFFKDIIMNALGPGSENYVTAELEECLRASSTA